MLGVNPALESNLQLVFLPSETAELGRPEKDLEGCGGLDSLVWQEETEHHVVWSTRVDAHTCGVHRTWPLLGNLHGNSLAGNLVLQTTGHYCYCCRTLKTLFCG